jgi:hypothetical protein
MLAHAVAALYAAGVADRVHEPAVVLTQILAAVSVGVGVAVGAGVGVAVGCGVGVAVGAGVVVGVDAGVGVGAGVFGVNVPEQVPVF